MSGKRHLIILAIAALVLPVSGQVDINALRQGNTSALQLRGLDRAVMVRDRELPVSREETTNLMLVCRQKGVTAIFVSCYELPPQAFFDRARVYRWMSMISEAHRQGLNVYATAGNVGWVNDTGRALQQIDAVAQLGELGGPGATFDGLLIEFPALSRLHTLLPAPATNQPTAEYFYQAASTNRNPPRQLPRADEEAADNDRDNGVVEPSTPDLYPTYPTFDATQLGPSTLEDRAMLRQHFDVLAFLKEYLDRRYASQRLQVGVSVPAWLQLPVGYGPEIKPAVNHFIDLADFTVLHNLPGETTAIGRVANNPLRYAGETGKRAFLRLELGLPSRPEPQLISLFDYDELLLEGVLLDLIDRHGSTPGFAGVLLDDYRSYLRLPASRELPGMYLRRGVPKLGDELGDQPWRRIEGVQP